MPRVIWDPDAEDDLRTIAYSIGVEGQSPRGARNVIRDIREKCALHATQPLSRLSKYLEKPRSPNVKQEVTKTASLVSPWTQFACQVFRQPVALGAQLICHRIRREESAWPRTLPRHDIERVVRRGGPERLAVG